VKRRKVVKNSRGALALSKEFVTQETRGDREREAKGPKSFADNHKKKRTKELDDPYPRGKPIQARENTVSEEKN